MKVSVQLSTKLHHQSRTKPIQNNTLDKIEQVLITYLQDLYYDSQFSSPWNKSKAFLNTIFLSSVLLFQCMGWVKNNPTSLELSCIYNIFYFFHSPYFLSSCHCSLLSWVFAAYACQKSSRTVGPMFKTSPLQLQPKIICNQVISVATAKKRYQFCLQSFFLLFLLPGRFWVSPDSKVRSYHLLVQQQS